MKLRKKKTYPGDSPTGKKRTFQVTYTKEVTLTLDESVVAQGLADDGFIMKSPSEFQVVEHLAFNLSNGLSLSQIDGYANCPDDSASVIEEYPSVEFYETTVPKGKK